MLFKGISKFTSSDGHFVSLIGTICEFVVESVIENNPGPEVIKRFSYSTQLSTKFILLINVKMPTIVGILTFMSMINTS